MVIYRTYKSMSGKGYRVDKYAEDSDLSHGNTLLGKKYFKYKYQAEKYARKMGQLEKE